MCGKELGKSAPVNFYNRFKVHLKTELNIDVDSDFTCKWKIIEKCLYKALSKEQNTTWLANFYNTGYEAFHSKPFELLINDVDTFVDTTLGTSTASFTDSKGRVLSNYLYSIRHKYELIFNIARHLNNDFKIVKTYIMQEITKMSDELEKVVDIGDFQTNIAIILESKGVLSQFKNEDIPAPKKNVAVNEVKVKNDKKKETVEEPKEALEKFNKE